MNAVISIREGLLLALLALPVAGAAEPRTFDVDVTLVNDFDKSFTDLPVFLQVFRVFGRGVDYTAFDPDGFSVLDDKGNELPHVVRPVPPDFSLANDQIVVFLPSLAKGETVTLRIRNAKKSGPARTAYDPERLLGNPNNLIPNGGFEKGVEGWEGGKLVQDTRRSGKSALLLEVPGYKGHAVLRCTQPLRFVKGKNYHISIWAKCENVVRRTWRYNYVPEPISARIMLSGNPLVFPDEALKKAGLPPLIYMIWDEPRFCDPKKFGILKGTGALTTSDITYIEACDSMRQGLFTHTAIDGPGCDYGPAMRRFAERHGAKVGWDTQFGPFCNRYQTGLMLANGGWMITDWHSAWYIVQHQGQKTWARSPALVGAAEGMIDFRYHLTLQDLIAQAKRTGKAAKEVKAAEDDQKAILAFCTDDFHFISDKEIFTYNGGPERWGDDWFYDQWRGRMRRHIVAIAKEIR